MEALVLIFGEIIFAVFAPLVTLIIDGIGLVIASLIAWLSPNRKHPRPSSGIAKKVLIVLLILAGGIFGGLFVANQFFFANSVRFVFNVLEDNAGIETRCEQIDGSVFAGQLSLNTCRIVRSGHPSTNFDLELDDVRLDLKVTSLFGTAEIETAYVSGLTGTVDKPRLQDTSSSNADAEKPRRPFVIQDLRIQDITIDLSGYNKDGGRFELPVTIDSASSAPLRSKLALFDILFRSNASGTIAGAEFEIKTSGESIGRKTVWRAADVPVAQFGAMTGGVLSWFHTGVVDLHVEDQWSRDGQLDIEMDWKLGFRDIKVKAPETAGVVTKLAAGPITDYVNSQGGEFPFEFQMTVNEDQFEYKSSLVAAGLWTAVGDSIKNVLKGFGHDLKATGAETGEKLKEGAKNIIDRFRKPKDEEED